MDPTPLIMTNALCPGDALVMSAAVESLHLAHPGEFTSEMRTVAQPIWEHNPRHTVIPDALTGSARTIAMHYPLVNHSNQRAVHFMQGYCDFLADTLGVPVPLMVNAPVLVLSEDEKSWLNQVAEILPGSPKFWVVNAGTKADYTAKGWGTANYQGVVDRLRGRVLFAQIGESHHLHEKLDGVIDLRGKTDTRQLIRLCWHAQGGLGPSTFLQHIMAAHGKPYVCLAGGREAIAWMSYPKQTTLHSIGKLECCRDGGCWKSRTVRRNDGSDQDNSVCVQPVPFGGAFVPRCLALFTPDDVVRAVESYYNGGILTY
jgi:ADP-heptose:LPS heptosyltransferase